MRIGNAFGIFAMFAGSLQISMPENMLKKALTVNLKLFSGFALYASTIFSSFVSQSLAVRAGSNFLLLEPSAIFVRSGLRKRSPLLRAMTRQIAFAAFRVAGL